MSVLLHPTINWQGWQEIKQSAAFKALDSEARLRLIHQLPHNLWAWEIGDGEEIDLLLENLDKERQERD